MAKRGPKPKSDFAEKAETINVKPSAISERNLPPKPTTLNVCGNVIPVKGGKASEADPKVLRRRRREQARRRGENEDETRI